MTLIDSYADWVRNQPPAVIRQNLQLTRQNLAEIEVSPDLSQRDREVIGAVWRHRAEIEEAALTPAEPQAPASLTVTVYTARHGQIARGPLKGKFLEDAIAELRHLAGFNGPVDLTIGQPYRLDWRGLWREVKDVTISRI